MLNESFKVVLGLVLLLTIAVAAQAQGVSREQIKGLDEQVQDIKSDVLSIAAELNLLEEKLLYPSHTQTSVFVSLAKGEALRLDSLEIKIDGKSVARHLYSFRELEALKRGGVQRIYTGNITTGVHEMLVFCIGKTEGGADIGMNKSFNVEKGKGPKIVEVVLGRKSITFRDQ